jgi:hypothetical protein
MRVLIDSAYTQLPTTQVGPFRNTDFGRTITEQTEQTGLLAVAQMFLDTPYRRVAVLRGTKLVGQISRRNTSQAAHNLMAIPQVRETSLLYLSAIVERSEAPLS